MPPVEAGFDVHYFGAADSVPAKMSQNWTQPNPASMLAMIAAPEIFQVDKSSQLMNYWNRAWSQVDILRKSGRLSGDIRLAKRTVKLTIAKELNREGREAAFPEVETLAFLYGSEICRWAYNAVLQRYGAKVETIEFTHNPIAGFGIRIG